MDSELATAESTVKAVSKQYAYFQEMRRYLRDLAECLDEKAPLIAQHTEAIMQAEQRIRQSRRYRAVALRAAQPGSFLYDDGIPSDDGGETDSADTAEVRIAACDACADAFDDVVEELASIECVQQRMEAWKREFPIIYRDTFVSASLPSLLAPYVQQDLAAWDPTRPDHGGVADFESQRWFRALLLYGQADANGSLMADDDPDTDLIPHLVELCVYPHVAQLVARVWDPFSRKHTNRLVELLVRLHDYPMHDASAHQSLREAFLQRLERAATTDDANALAAGVPGADASPALLSWRAWRAVRLVRNTAGMLPHLPPEPLQRFVASAIETMLLPVLRCSAACHAPIAWLRAVRDAVIEAVPVAWASAVLPPEFGTFADALPPSSTADGQS